MKLTKTEIAKLPVPAKDCCVWDDDLHGFRLRLQPSGAQSFIAQYDLKGDGRTRKTRNQITGAEFIHRGDESTFTAQSG